MSEPVYCLKRLGCARSHHNLTFCSDHLAVKIEEPASMEIDNHMSEKDDGCYDNAEAAFSDDEDDLNSKGEECSQLSAKCFKSCTATM